MRVSFSIDLKPESGKQKFAIQLASALSRKGVQVTSRKPHVNLVFLDGVRRKCKNIFRLDGILLNTRVNYRKKNKKLLNTINQCDGIVYQNEFCEKCGRIFLGEFKIPGVCILNGAALPPDIHPYKNSRPYLLAISRWRPHKRLKAIVDSFLYAGMDKNYDLLVLGDPDYVKKHQAVKYLGRKNVDETWSVIKGSEYAVHLAYLDWCPNSVVESLVCGKNVMHTTAGGTKHVVRENGIRINDSKYKYKPIDLYAPPPLDMEEVKSGYEKMFTLSSPQVDYLHIDIVADQYISFFQKVLS